MSRTYRKQSGNRYWRDAHRSKHNFTCGRDRRFFALKEPAIPFTREEIEEDMQNDIINNEKKDGHWWDSISKAVKWHSNKMVRQGNRRELHLVMQDPENYEYNRDHDLRKRGLWWAYD